MKIRVKTIGCGIFSLFSVGIQHLLQIIKNVDEIESLYFEIDKARYNPTGMGIRQLSVQNETGNPFDFVLDQTVDDSYITVHAQVWPVCTDHAKLYGTEELRRLRVICSKIKVKDIVTSRIDLGIDDQTLGVHVRLTDMLRWHPQYHNNTNTVSYIEAIQTLLDSKGDIKNIFVASDNDYSLQAIRDRFTVISNEVGNRNKTEIDGAYFDQWMSQIEQKEFWIDSFLEMMSLSRCGTLLHKVSGVSNTALFFSKTLHESMKL